MKLLCFWGVKTPLTVFRSSGMWRCDAGFWIFEGTFLHIQGFCISSEIQKSSCRSSNWTGRQRWGEKERANEEGKRAKEKGREKSRRNPYEEKDKREEIRTEKAKKKVILLFHLHACHIRITSLHKNAGSHCCGIKKNFHLTRPRTCLVHHMLIFFTH